VKKYILGLLTIFLFAGINLLWAQDKKNQHPDQKDLNILIYSTSHNSSSRTQQKQGVLKIVVSTFAPILYVDINGNIVSDSAGTKVQLDYPFSLQNGSNEFLVTAASESGINQQKFNIQLEEQTVQKEKLLHLVGIGSVSYLDNVNNESEKPDHESAIKSSLTAVPIYKLKLDGNATLNLKAIILREKYLNSEYKGKEASYTQASARWIKEKTPYGKIFAEGGINDIRTDNAIFILGKTEESLELFIGGGLKQKINDKTSWSAKTSYKLVDSKADITDSGDDEDGGVFDLRGSLFYNYKGIDGTGSLGYGFYDAKGDYKDNTSTEFRLKAVYPMNLWTPSLEIKVQGKKSSSNDPRKGVTPKDTTTIYNLKANYKMQSNLRLDFSYQNKKQTSNVKSSEYSGTILKCSVIYLY